MQPDQAPLNTQSDRAWLGTLIALLVLMLLLVIYFFAGPYLDRRAVRLANEFCASVSVGETVDTLSAKAEKASVELQKWGAYPDGTQQLMVQFSGFVANAAYCDIRVNGMTVIGKGVDAEFW